MDAISQQVADKNGNKLIIKMSGNVFLKLSTEKRQRRLGFIDRAKKLFIINRKREKHLHRKSNSYGFNHHLISKSKSFDKILLRDEFGEYQFPISKVLDHGQTYLHFQQQGFELQVFLPLEIIELHRKSQKIPTYIFD